MTRIIAGKHGGRRLAVPPGSGTRPTSDRVREALFSSLESRLDLQGCRFADLFAGSGAVGLEALSRGAEHVLLVESDSTVVKVIRENVGSLGAHSVDVRVAKAEQVVANEPEHGYDVIFIDPPYALGEAEVAGLLAKLVEHHWLAEGAIVVVERSRRSPEPAWPDGLEAQRPKKYGETTLWYAHYA